MIEFLNYAKINLSICIDEIIIDEEDKKEWIRPNKKIFSKEVL